MKKNAIVALFLCAIFILSALPVIGQTREEMQNPYRLVTTLEEARAVSRMRDGSIPVTNIAVPEIISGDVNGIIITEQCLYEALAALSDAFMRYEYVIPHLITTSITICDWEPTPEQLERMEYIMQSSAGMYGLGPRGTTPPTTLPPNWHFSHNWSGTINYTYTRHLIPGSPPGMGNSGSFLTTWADTNHHVTYRARDGRNLGTRIATQGPTRFHTGMSMPETFYGEIHNRPWGTPSRNAWYEINL